jgi:MFS family permease
MPFGPIRHTSSTSSEASSELRQPEVRVRRVPGKSSRLQGSSSLQSGELTSRPRLRMVGVPMRYHSASASAPSGRASNRTLVESPDTAVAGRHRQRAGGPRHLAQVLFINRNFALLWWGQAISSIGDYAWDTALVLWIATFLAKGRPWAPLAVSGVLLAAALPQIVVGPIAGVFVDRLDKRRTMIGATCLQVIFALLLLLLFGGSRLPLLQQLHLSLFWTLAIVYADVAAITICSQFFLPAQFALIKDIVPLEKQDQAIESSQAIAGLAIIIGPPVAAALVFGLGVPWALLLNALSFVVSLAATAAIVAPPSASSLAVGETGHFSREFIDGFSYVLKHTILRTILFSEILTWLGLGSLQTLGYFFITENLKAPPGAYGLLGADFGLGAVVGALVVTIFGERIGLTRLLWTALIAAGLFVTVMSHLTALSLALVAAFFFGISATAIIVTSGALALHATSREYVGRVTAVINPLGRLAALISIAVAGYLVGSVLQDFHASILGLPFGPVDTVFTVMGLLAVVGGLYARINLRDA